MRRISIIAVLLLSLAAAGLSAGPARAAGGSTSVPSPFSLGVPGSSAPQTTTAAVTPTVSTSTSSGDGSFSGTDVLIIAIGVALVIVAIAAYVWRDSRLSARRLPHQGQPGLASSGVRAGSKPPTRSRKLSAQEKRRRKRGRAPRRR